MTHRFSRIMPALHGHQVKLPIEVESDLWGSLVGAYGGALDAALMLGALASVHEEAGALDRDGVRASTYYLRGVGPVDLVTLPADYYALGEPARIDIQQPSAEELADAMAEARSHIH